MFNDILRKHCYKAYYVVKDELAKDSPTHMRNPYFEMWLMLRIKVLLLFLKRIYIINPIFYGPFLRIFFFKNQLWANSGIVTKFFYVSNFIMFASYYLNHIAIPRIFIVYTTRQFWNLLMPSIYCSTKNKSSFLDILQELDFLKLIFTVLFHFFLAQFKLFCTVLKLPSF